MNNEVVVYPKTLVDITLPRLRSFITCSEKGTYTLEEITRAVCDFLDERSREVAVPAWEEVACVERRERSEP